MIEPSSPKPIDLAAAFGTIESTAAGAHASAIASRLPVLDGPRVEVRRLFLLFYFVTDDSCITHRHDGAVVDLALVDAVRRCVVEVLDTGRSVHDAAVPGQLFQRFWRSLTEVIPPDDCDRLKVLLCDMADAMRVKYRCIDSQTALSWQRFLRIRRRIPAMTFIELERALRAIPTNGASADPVLLPLTEAVADCISWTNDLYSAEKEQDEGFNLVLVIREAFHMTLPMAADGVSRFIAARYAKYVELSADLRGNPQSSASGLLALYDELLAMAAPLHKQSSRYQG